MALLQLVAYGTQNAYIPRNLSIEYFTENFEENSLNMTRDCDVKIPEYLEFELSPNVSINDFKIISHKITLDMVAYDQLVLLSIPLRFMLHLKNYEVCDNKIYVEIPFQMFFDEIKLIALQYHNIKFKLTNTGTNFTFCKLISKGIYYDNEIRNQMIRNPHEELVQQLNSTEITSSNPRNEFKYKVPFEGIHKGFYIECENVDEINEISLDLNRIFNRFVYNRFFLRTKCVKISQQLLYIPMNFDKSHRGKKPEEFEGSINLSRIDSAVFTIKFDTLNTKICIYSLGTNVFKIMCGMCGLMYPYSRGNLYDEYEENGVYNVTHNSTQILSPQTNNPAQLPTSNTIYKIITDSDKIICCISQENITAGMRYMSCSRCHNNFNEGEIRRWLSQRTTRNPCPMCRAKWTDFNIYINNDEPIQEPNTQVVWYRRDDPYLESQDLNPPTTT